jgi:hypothetical protein
MPTKIVIALVAVAALVFALRDSEKNAAAGQAGNPVEQGLERFDSMLQQGLSQDTHDAISDRLSAPISGSSEFLVAVESRVPKLSE